MGDYGIRFSPGYNVFNATEDQLRFNTKYAVLKAFKWGDLTFNPSTNGSYNHNLGYAPSFFGFRKLGDNSFALLGAGTSMEGDTLAITGDPEEYFGVSLYTDSTKIQVLTDTFWNYSKASGTIRYYLMADRAQQFTGDDGMSMEDKAGIRFAPSGKNVLTAKEYELAFSTKYKIIQYYPESVKSATLTLPALWSSYFDTDNDEYTYVDFTHGFNFPPFFRAWYHTGDNLLREIPFNVIGSYGIAPNDLGYINQEVSAACNDSKIRVLFRRQSIYTVAGNDSYLDGAFSATTITVVVAPYFVNLLEAAN
jgi:hypothetical protein